MEQNSNPAAARDKLKRRIIVVFVSACVLLLLAYGAVSLVERLLYGAPQENYSSSYIFHEADYDADIYADVEYMDLNRYITFSDGVVSTVLEED